LPTSRITQSTPVRFSKWCAGSTAGWFGHTGAVPGYNTAAYYFPAQKITIIVLVNSGTLGLPPGVANAIVQDIATIVTPQNIPF
jgi:hypothetical protein